MRDYERVLQPGESTRIDAPEGDFFRVKSANIQVQFDFETVSGQQNSRMILGETGYFRLAQGKFREIRVTNNTNAVAQLVLSVGYGDTGDNNQSGEINAQIAPAVSHSGLEPLTVDGAGVIPGNNDRAMLVLYADADNAHPVFFGSSDGSTGIPLLPNGTTERPITGPLNVWSAGPATLYIGEDLR